MFTSSIDKPLLKEPWNKGNLSVKKRHCVYRLLIESVSWGCLTLPLTASFEPVI